MGEARTSLVKGLGAFPHCGGLSVRIEGGTCGRAHNKPRASFRRSMAAKTLVSSGRFCVLGV
jgi:hypothetical protein